MIEFHEATHRCYRCDAAAWEIVGDRELRINGRRIREDVVQCVFCGVYDAVEASAATPLRATIASDGFRFQYGRFRGLTLAETDAQPNGRRYLEHMRDTNEKLRQPIAEYLSSAAPSA